MRNEDSTEVHGERGRDEESLLFETGNIKGKQLLEHDIITKLTINI